MDLTGGTCTSCSIAIEHFGKRLKGVHDIIVDRGTSTIQLEYDGNPEILEQISELVRRIGYEASVRYTD